MKPQLCFALLVLVAPGCDKKTEGTPGAVAPPAPTTSQAKIKQATDALTSAGFKADAITDADPKGFSAQKCVYGKLDGLEAVLCEYGSAEAVAMGKKSATSWLGDAPTAVVLDNGLALLTVVDRTWADPNGKTLHKMTQAFLKAR
jgi:hypothetical protein